MAIRYAAPSVTPIGPTRYQLYLEGREETWSPWTEQAEWAYHDLREGHYTFHVRAQSADGRTSEVASFSFEVLPPWHRSWWAYLTYLGLLTAGLVAAHRYRALVVRTRRMEEHARELARERTLTKRLQLANETLRRADQLKDELLANTSHELRTPITAILGFAAVLKEEVDEPQREFVEVIESSSKRLLTTVNELLDFAKLEAGRMEVEQRVVDVAECAQEVVQTVAPLARGKALDLTLETEGAPHLASLDPVRLEQILFNLIGNAIKFTEEGFVSVRVTHDDARVVLTVADSGIGIAESFIPHLFEAFRQESTGLARLHEGNGLGLAITARLVALMGGRIDVASKQGEGSVFTVSFPRAQVETRDTAVSAASGEA